MAINAIEASRRNQRAGCGQEIPPLDHCPVDPLEVDGRPLSRLGALDGPVVDLKPPHLGPESHRGDLHLLADRYPAGDQRSRDDGAEAFHREDPIDRQTEEADVGRRFDIIRNPGDGLDDLGKTRPRQGGDRNDRRPLEKGPPEELADVLPDERQPLLVHHVDLREGDEPFLYPEEGADLEMLPRLRHDPLVGRDDHHHQVDPGRPGHHVPDEPLVARDVDDPEETSVGKGERGEPELDRDPPPLFLLEPVGVHAGETLDQRRLAVIHMAGRAHHDMLHALKSTRLTRFSQQQIWPTIDAEEALFSLTEKGNCLYSFLGKGIVNWGWPREICSLAD